MHFSNVEVFGPLNCLEKAEYQEDNFVEASTFGNHIHKDMTCRHVF